MAIVTSRADLVQYCYRVLGAPLVEINITDEQADDIIDNAIDYFREFYFDGLESTFFKWQVTQTDIDNKYITLPDNIWGVKRVFPATGVTNASTNIFDLSYQLRMNDLRDVTSTSMIYYTQMMGHLALLDNLLNTQKQFRWNRITNKLYIDQDWSSKDPLDTFILIDAYAVIDPTVNMKFWDDRYFKKYCVALFKKQVGQNIKKYNGIALPGGVTIDGQAMYDEGVKEATDLEMWIANQAPLEWFLG